jgi:hypothetical protein
MELNSQSPARDEVTAAAIKKNQHAPALQLCSTVKTHSERTIDYLRDTPGTITKA